MNTWQFHLLNWQWLRLVRVISVSFIYTVLLVITFLQSHKLNVTFCLWPPYYLHSALFACVVDKTKMSPQLSHH